MKLKLLTIAFILFSMVPFVSSARGQQKGVGAPGTEAPLYQQTDKTTQNSCYVYKQFVVTSIPSKEDIGEDIIIFKRNATDFRKNCAQNRRQVYMTLPSTDNSSFYGLTGDIFLVDNGTSAGERGLDIVSLAAKKVVRSVAYYEEPKVVGNAVIYNKPSEKKGSLKACPNALKWRKQGGGEGWVQPTRLDLKTLKETPVGSLKCIYLE
jgi:hypothetical protein